MSNPYVSFTWVDRDSEYPTRRKLVDTTTQEETQVVVSRDEGTVTEQGTPFTAYYMNNLESRVNAAFAAMNNELTATLTAGSTSLTSSLILTGQAAILTTSTIDVYTDTYGISPETVTVATGSVTLTFEAQASDLGVKVKVMN